MIGDRLLAVGGAKVVGALALGCLLLGVLLSISVYVNVLQMRGKARAVGEVMAQLAASEATAAAEIAGCAATNANIAGTVTVLETELKQCRGQEQQIAERMALALRERDRARRGVTAEIKNRQILIQAVVDRDENCRNRPVCRALSDELLKPAPNGPAP